MKNLWEPFKAPIQYNFLVPQMKMILYYEEKWTLKAFLFQCDPFLPLVHSFFSSRPLPSHSLQTRKQGLMDKHFLINCLIIDEWSKIKLFNLIILVNWLRTSLKEKLIFGSLDRSHIYKSTLFLINFSLF